MTGAPKCPKSDCFSRKKKNAGVIAVDGKIDINLLLDFYGPLLDNRHRQTVEMYFADDMTLSEIAQELGVSRQAVQQSVAKGRGDLEMFEEKLGLCGRFGAAEKKIAEVKRLAEKIGKTAGPGEISELCEELRSAADDLGDTI